MAASKSLSAPNSDVHPSYRVHRSSSKRSTAPSPQSSALPVLNQKPRGISKARPKSKNRPKKPFSFLNLPAELRVNIFRFALDSEPAAFLSKRSRGNLITQSALARVNRNIREEFLSTVYIYAGEIKAHVKDFDFRHIVTFLNRLSDREMNALIEGPSSRSIQIELSFTSAFTSVSYSEDIALLDRWIKRLGHPTKKGTKILASYTVISNDSYLNCIVRGRNTVGFRRFTEQRMKQEAAKIEHAMRKWLEQTF